MIDIGFLSSLGGAAIIGGIGSVASTLLGNHSAKKEASRNREFQEEMSNTSVSRRMQDLRNAGLNPLLAVDNASAGASTPSGSQAQLQSFDPSFITALSTAKLQKKQGENADANSKAAEASAGLQKQQTINEEKQGKIIDSQSKIIDAQARKTNAEATAIENNNTLFAYDRARKELENALASHKINTEKLQQDVFRVNSLKAQTEIIKNRLDAKGIELENEQAEVVLSLLKKDEKAWENSTGAKNLDYVLEKLGQVADWIPGVDITTTTRGRGGTTTTTTRRSRGF